MLLTPGGTEPCGIQPRIFFAAPRPHCAWSGRGTGFTENPRSHSPYPGPKPQRCRGQSCGVVTCGGEGSMLQGEKQELQVWPAVVKPCNSLCGV